MHGNIVYDDVEIGHIIPIMSVIENHSSLT